MPTNSTRRLVLSGFALSGASFAVPSLARTIPPAGNTRALTLHNVWTKRETTFLLGRNEPVSREASKELSRFLLDHHNGRVGKMDPALISYLMDIQDNLELDNPTFYVLSAYRSRQTQRRLRRSGERVASNSMHLKGRAVDIRINDVKMRDLRDAALDLGHGGVGGYRRFVHFDTGPRRSW